MRYKTNTSEITYEARYRTPLFILAGNPVAVLDAVYSRLSPKYFIAANDMVVDPGKSVGEVRARVNLFAGRGILELSAESFLARFTDPHGPNDSATIKDCIELASEGLFKLGGASPTSFLEETITARFFAELVDSQPDAHLFLRNLMATSKPVWSDEDYARRKVVPGYHLEVLDDEEKWEFTLGLQRAIRSDKELFIVAIVRFRDGGRFNTLDEKSQQSVELIQRALTRLNLEPQAVA